MKKIWVNRNYTFHMAVRYAEPFQIDPNKGVEDRFHLNIGYYYVSLGDGKFHLASEEVAYTFFFFPGRSGIQWKSHRKKTLAREICNILLFFIFTKYQYLTFA
jgi:hypothetical protein